MNVFEPCSRKHSIVTVYFLLWRPRFLKATLDVITEKRSRQTLLLWSLSSSGISKNVVDSWLAQWTQWFWFFSRGLRTRLRQHWSCVCLVMLACLQSGKCSRIVLCSSRFIWSTFPSGESTS